MIRPAGKHPMLCLRNFLHSGENLAVTVALGAMAVLPIAEIILRKFSSQGLSGATAMVQHLVLVSAMIGGVLVALWISKNDPGFIHNGALAGLVAICAGSDKVHPLGALIIGGLAGAIFVKGFTWEQEKLKIDDVLGVWPLHGICGSWGGIACGIFGQESIVNKTGVIFGNP